MIKKSIAIVSASFVLFLGVSLPLSTVNATSSNLIGNSSLETVNPVDSTLPDQWFQGGFGTNNRTFEYPVAGTEGVNAAKVTISSYTDGDAKWYFTDVPVSTGNIYHFSDKYISNVPTVLYARYMVNGSEYYAFIKNIPASPVWTTAVADITPPTGATSLTIFHLLNGVGSLTVDDYSLTFDPITSVAPIPDPNNVVPNFSLEENNGGGLPTNWFTGNWGNNTTSFSYLLDGKSGIRSAKIDVTSYTDGDAKWYFTPVFLNSNRQYEFSDFYKSNVQTKVYVGFDLGGGVSSYQLIGLPEASTDWTQFKTHFSVPLGTVSATVYHLIDGVGYLNTDDASIVPFTSSALSKPIITLTFDDGYESSYTNVLPILNKYGFKSTQFIVSDFINQPGSLTNAQIKSLYDAGNEIGAHSKSHPVMTALS